jgi:hypothetical protein
MSDPDILADAARALRETADGTPPDAQPWTRARLLASARRDTRRRGRSVFAVVALAATLIGSTAWGAWTGRLPRWIELVTGRAPPAQPVVASPRSPPKTLEVHGQPPPEDTPVVPLSPDPATDHSSPDDRVDPAAAQPALASLTVVPHRAAAAPLTPAPAVHDEQALYAAAHRAHFVDRDPAAALQGWNRYLDEYPRGHFAPEAHYNRAISLARLGRRTEARAALAPFADGTYGGYRQSEARALRDALEPTDAGSRAP